MKKLTKAQILLLHKELINIHGGSDGIRDEGLLESALAAPFQTFDRVITSSAMQLVNIKNGYA